MTKKEILSQVERINMQIVTARNSLNELYANRTKLDEKGLKEEAKLLNEVARLRKEKQKYLNMKAESNKEESKSCKTILIGSMALLAIAILVTLSSDGCKRKKNSSEVPTDTKTIEMTVPYSTTPEPTIVAPTVSPEVSGMFADVESEEELIERAKLIYDIDLKPILEELNNKQLDKMITEEKLVDMLRMGLGQLPLNSEYDATSVDEMIMFRTEVFGNMGSDSNLTKVYPSHYAAFAPDGSELSEYMATYDELYNNIAEARNNNDMCAAVENIQALGKKHYNEFVLAGLYGDFNPYLLDSEYKQLAFAAADERYVSYVLEYILDNNLTICVPACYDPVTGEWKNINVVDIEEALVLGTSMNGKVSLSYYGDAQDVNLPREFYYNLTDKLDAKVLKRG